MDNKVNSFELKRVNGMGEVDRRGSYVRLRLVVGDDDTVFDCFLTSLQAFDLSWEVGTVA